MAYIYRIWNDINNKDYIGKTMNTVESRWKEHLSDMDKRVYEKRPLYSAMRKYGTSHFHIEPIEECSIVDLNNREIYWIDYYDSFKSGYNATRGGEGKAYADVEAIISLWNEDKVISEICEITGHDHATITKHLKDHGITAQDIKNRAKKRQSKPVAKLHKETGELLYVYLNAKEVEEELGKTMASRHIYEVCNGKRKTAYGYKWMYIQDIPGLEVEFK